MRWIDPWDGATHPDLGEYLDTVEPDEPTAAFDPQLDWDLRYGLNDRWTA